MNQVRWKAISFVMRQCAFPHIRIFSFLHRECINLLKGHLCDKIIIFKLHFERVFFYVKGFCPILRAANNSQEKFTILHVPHIGFLCYSD